MIIGLDIDNTISANPHYYAALCNKVYSNGGKVIIISSRSDTHDVRKITIQKLEQWNIRYEKLYLFRTREEIDHLCPEYILNWYDRYLWQKIYYCLNENIELFYDDDDKAIELFTNYAPHIKIMDAKNLC